jgi:putative ABC transport system permease protein
MTVAGKRLDWLTLAVAVCVCATFVRLFALAGLSQRLLVAILLLLGSIALLAVFNRVPLRYNLRNLEVRWRTTLITALAFTLVISIMTVMLAFVKGMDKLTEETGIPGNVMILSDGATDEAFSSLPPGISVHSLPKDLQDMIARDSQGKPLAAKEVYVIVNQMLPNPVPGGRQRRFLQMRGVEDPLTAATVHGIELAAGEWFSPQGVRKLSESEAPAIEAVLGDGVARTFGQDNGTGSVAPGEIVEIGPRKWYVVGVMKPSASAFGSEIWAKDEFVARYFGRVKDGAVSYNSIVIRAKDPERAPEAAAMLKKEHSQEAFAAFTEREYYSKLSDTNKQFLGAVMVIAVIMAFGGVLGIMNTMFAAISQRSKDIGVMRLLGFSRRQVLMSFLLESVVIAFLGGLLGCALGSLANGWTATSIVNSSGGGGKSVVLRLVVDGATLGWGLLFTLVMGVVGGLIPALFSMRLRPLESLR